MDAETKSILRRCAEKYERPSFIEGDPSWFMHQVKGAKNQEATAFVASALSFGSRAQFLPKVQWIVDQAKGNVDRFPLDQCVHSPLISACQSLITA